MVSSHKTFAPTFRLGGKRKDIDDKINMFKINYVTIVFKILSPTRPKPAYGRQGLAGSWGKDTDEVSTFLVF